MQQKLLQHCIIVSCISLQLSIPPRILHRLPCEEENLEPISLVVVVCSSRFWLQHKASCYCGHGYPNRLSSLQGQHYYYPARSNLQGGVHLVRKCPTEAIRYVAVHPSRSTERPSAGLNPKHKGTLDPRPLYSCTVHDWPVKQTHLPLPE